MSVRGLAAVARRFGDPLSIEEMEFRDPAAHGVLVKIEFTGVCHTDLHAINGEGLIKAKVPFVPGHEGAGTVFKVGTSVTNLKEGDRVGLPLLYEACGTCEWCLTESETICPNAIYRGISTNGTFAEYCLAAAAYVIPLPAQLSKYAAAPVLCAGAAVWKALKDSGVHAGDWVAISGIGGVGHLALQYARAMGLQVAAIDIADDKLALATKEYADLVIDGREFNVGEKLQREIGGAHAVIVTAPSVEAFHESIAITRKKGTCIMLALPPGELSVPLTEVMLRGITVRGSLAGTRRDAREALTFARRGRVRPAIHERPFKEVNEALNELAEGKVQGRIVLHF